MTFQEKMIERTAGLRTRAAAIATVAVKTARARAEGAAKRVGTLKGSLAALTVAGRELNKVARRHAVRFVKENSSIAVEAGKDVSALARTTYASLAKRPVAAKSKARKTTSTRKRPAGRKAA
jgi:hypothetical protein